jgi:hypothetical protein
VRKSGACPVIAAAHRFGPPSGAVMQMLGLALGKDLLHVVKCRPPPLLHQGRTAWQQRQTQHGENKRKMRLHGYDSPKTKRIGTSTQLSTGTPSLLEGHHLIGGDQDIDQVIAFLIVFSPSARSRWETG